MEDGFNVVGFNNPDGEILVCECVCVDELQFALSTPEVLKIMDAILYHIRRSGKRCQQRMFIEATLPQVGLQTCWVSPHKSSQIGR